MRYIENHRAVSQLGESKSNVTVHKMEYFNLDQYLHINPTTLKALQIFNSESHPSRSLAVSGREGFSVFGYLQESIATKAGSAMLREWFLKPVRDLDIIQERLDREFGQNVITTIPNVSYFAYTKKDQKLDIRTPSELPDPTLLARVEEPFIVAQVITKPEYIGSIMTLAMEKRGMMTKQDYLTQDRVELTFDLPLAEIVFDFYDRLKSISRGYASFDYQPSEYKPSDLVKLDIKLNGESVDALSALVHREKAAAFGRKICKRLKELLPRQQFMIAIQAAIGAKIIARETISALRKDVTAKCYGGDITRKRKLLEKQKKGKKKMRQIGNVEVPQKAFLEVLKLD